MRRGRGRNKSQGVPQSLLTLAAAALAAMDDGQHDRLGRAARTGQAEDAHGAAGVQAVTAALTQRLQVRLLCGHSTVALLCVLCPWNGGGTRCPGTHLGGDSGAGWAVAAAEADLHIGQ